MMCAYADQLKFKIHSNNLSGYCRLFLWLLLFICAIYHIGLNSDTIEYIVITMLTVVLVAIWLLLLLFLLL